VLRYVLLALLADGNPAHGYALMKAYQERSGVRLSIGNVYRELQRLVGHGWISTAANPAGADPRRAPYTITASGRDALARWLSEPAFMIGRGVPDEITHRLALIGDIDIDTASRFLEDLHAELWSRAKALERERALTAQKEKAGRPLSTRGVLLTRSVRHITADIELVEDLRARVAGVRKKTAIRSQPTQMVDRKALKAKHKPALRRE
jgi:DNA-binding PadR family transcriptional regulator